MANPSLYLQRTFSDFAKVPHHFGMTSEFFLQNFIGRQETAAADTPCESPFTSDLKRVRLLLTVGITRPFGGPVYEPAIPDVVKLIHARPLGQYFECMRPMAG